MPNPYNTPLSRLLNASDIPGDFTALEDVVQEGIDLILGKVFYKDLVSDVSQDGVSRNYSLTIIAPELKLPLPGGMDLVFFKGAVPGTSDFPIILRWRWEVYKYIARLDAGGLSALPEVFVDILLELIGITSHEEFFGKILGVFLDDGTTNYQTFITNLITKVGAYDNGVSGVTTEITNITDQLGIIVTEVDTLLGESSNSSLGSLFASYQDNSTLQGAVDSIQNSLEVLSNDYNIDLNLLSDLVQAAISLFTDIDKKFEKLAQLFVSWFDGITKQDFYDLLLPTFSFELSNISAGLMFPRTWLVPVEESPPGSNNWIEHTDPNRRASLDFTIGKLKCSSQHGFEFENQSSFTFEKAMIGKTGIMLEFINLKVDFSKTYNIPEADADGRPSDFMGMYAERASVTLPAKWFKDPDGTNAEIFGEKLLIGTGGLSGTIGLRAVGGDNMFWVKLGDSDGFQLGFHSFDISFKQNKVLSSNIAAAMKIKKFVYPDGHPNAGQIVTINITGHIHDDGDFNLTASTDPAYPITLPNVFTYSIRSLELGSQDDKFYVGTSGKLEFMGFLKDTLKLGAIDIEKLRIYSDGTIEFEGGSICLVEPIVLSLGPVEITVTAIHYGSHQKEVGGVMRKFNYFGFDGGISVDPLGIEVRGDGVKFYYCSDDLPNKPSPYLHIQTLYIDLTIPASSPAVIINGWLSIPEPGTSPEYAGGIKLQIPAAKISGSADMKLMPKYPAFIIDASIELPAPIPLGPVAIYGFRGLIGYRYVAEKEAIGLVSGVNTWYEYYTHAPRGIHVTKFSGPDRTKTSGTPFSLGAGASLGTSPDNGTILNIKAMVLLSIPSLFMIDGRAAVLSARLGLEDTKDPPFFAFIAVGDNSLEFGFGADFKMPTSSGDIITLYAAVEAGFFFNDSSKWYVNFGTKTNPITAKIIRILTIKSFLMLSAKGIEAGARGDLSFDKTYGPIHVKAWAYIELGGKISFERPQFGAYMAAGVGADIDIKIISLYASFDILFGVEGAKPFKIYGEFHVCVKIKILWVFSFKFCGDLSVEWEFNHDVDRSPVNPMVNQNSATPIGDLVKGVNMLSNETFELAYIGSSIPANSLPAAVLQKIVPLDTYIDIKSEKGLIPNAISTIIGGVTNPPKRYEDLVPPDKIIRGKEVRQVKHQYSVTSFQLKSWNPSGSGSWQDYHPWKALYPTDAALDPLRAGQFQKTDGQYNTIRVLATSPLSYTEQGLPGWYIPEQYGLTPGVLFCQGEQLVPHCANFLEKPLGHQYHCPDDNNLFYSNGVAFLLLDHRPNGYAEVVSETNPFSFQQSLKFQNAHRLQVRLPQPSVEVTVLITTHASAVRINYYASLIDDDALEVPYGNPDITATDPSAPYSVVVPQSALSSPVTYLHPEWLAVTRIEIDPIMANEADLVALQEQIAAIIHHNNLIALELEDGKPQDTEALEAELEKLRSMGCEYPKPIKRTAFIAPIPPQQSGFVNEYGAPEVVWRSTAVFLEGESSFQYAVGNSETRAVVLKTTTDGSTVWAMDLEVGKVALRCYEIIQVQGKRGTTYVISAYDGERFYLFAIDPDGAQLWAREIMTLDADIHAMLLSTPKGEGFYFVYSDKNDMDTSPTPKVTLWDAEGNLHIQRQLYTPGTEHAGFILNTAGAHANGLTVGGRIVTAQTVKTTPKAELFEDNKGVSAQVVPHSIGITMDLKKTLLGTAGWYYDQMTIQDLIMAGSGKYIVSAYYNPLNSVVLFQHGLYDEPLLWEVPKSRNMQSVLCMGDEAFYLSTHNKTEGKVIKLDLKFLTAWTKGTRLVENELGLRSMAYQPQGKVLAFTTLDASLVGESGPELDTCIAYERPNEQLKRHALKTGRMVMRTKEIKLRVLEADGKWRRLRPRRIPICGGSQEPEKPKCHTLLHQICWLSIEDYQYNILIPSQAAIQEDTEATVLGMSGYIQPVWRPDTSYAISFELRDDVDNGAGGGSFTYAFGFTTGGPVGYFHTHANAHYGDAAHPEKFPLTSLRQYIDYNRSYPNADGNLLNCKPLFYDSPVTQIDLYFQKAWARHFFHEWPAYNGLPAATGRLKIVIKDPVEGSEVINPPYLDYDPLDTVHTSTPQSIESWQDDPNAPVPPIYQMYENLLDSQTCVLLGGYNIVPKSESAQIVPKHLKPSKLYTAIVNNLYDLDKDGDLDALNETREVHKFTFQTSRYKDFKEQVNSYLLEYTDASGTTSRPAIFRVEKSLTPAELAAAYATVAGDGDPLADAIKSKYQHPFDRAIEGILALSPLDSAQFTEFNIIRNTADSDKIVAVLIRNPEPFNHPRMPLEDVQDTVTVLPGGFPALGYKVLFSKDYSQVLVMHDSLEITGPWDVRFEYKRWDGTAYVVPGTANGYLTDEVGTIVVAGLDFTSI